MQSTSASTAEHNRRRSPPAARSLRVPPARQPAPTTCTPGGSAVEARRVWGGLHLAATTSRVRFVTLTWTLGQIFVRVIVGHPRWSNRQESSFQASDARLRAGPLQVENRHWNTRKTFIYFRQFQMYLIIFSMKRNLLLLYPYSILDGGICAWIWHDKSAFLVDEQNPAARILCRASQQTLVCI